MFGEKYAYSNVFYNVNEFYVFSAVTFTFFSNKLPAENCRYINGDIYVKPCMSVSENKRYFDDFNYLLAAYHTRPNVDIKLN